MTIHQWLAAVYLAPVAFTSFFLTTPALADDACKNRVVMVDSLTLSPVSENDPRLTVPVTINGQDEAFLFDTGGYEPQISQELVDRLKLGKIESSQQMYGTAGERSDYYTIVDFTMGKVVKASRSTIMISPNASIVSPVFMGRFDFDFDIANRKLNILSGDHCPGQVIYWPYKVATVVPYTKRNNNFIILVTVDGKDFTAIIDTGATNSVIRQDLATQVFGLTPDSPGMVAAGHVGGDEKAVAYRYPFKTLTFGDISVNNPRITILPDVVGKNADKTMVSGGHITAASENLKLPQFIVGMDVLRRLHVYFAQDERKLYITDAGAPAKPQ